MESYKPDHVPDTNLKKLAKQSSNHLEDIRDIVATNFHPSLRILEVSDFITDTASTLSFCEFPQFLQEMSWIIL
jgi:hypothetical protein